MAQVSFGGLATPVPTSGAVDVGTPTDPEAAGDGTVIAILKRQRTLLVTIIALLGAGLPAALISDRLKVNAVTALATAAAPSKLEGATSELSINLAGALRTTTGDANAYMAIVNASAAAANKDHLTLFNGAGSGQVISVRKISIAPQLTAAVVGLVQSFEVHEVSTAGATCTNGLLRKNRTSNPNIPAQIVVTTNCTTDPVSSAVFMVCSVNGEETSSDQSLDGNCYLHTPGMQPIVLVEGMGIELRSTALSGAWPVHLRVEFTL